MSRFDSTFQDRLDRIHQDHQLRQTRGVVRVLRADGLIIEHPGHRRRRQVPVRGFVLIALAFIGFKVLVLASLGQGAYQARVNTLAQGTVFEQIGAQLMNVDPVTAAVAKEAARFLR